MHMLTWSNHNISNDSICFPKQKLLASPTQQAKISITKSQHKQWWLSKHVKNWKRTTKPTKIIKIWTLPCKQNGIMAQNWRPEQTKVVAAGFFLVVCLVEKEILKFKMDNKTHKVIKRRTLNGKRIPCYRPNLRSLTNKSCGYCILLSCLK